MLMDQFCVSKLQKFNRLVISDLLKLLQIKGKLHTAKQVLERVMLAMKGFI